MDSYFVFVLLINITQYWNCELFYYSNANWNVSKSHADMRGIEKIVVVIVLYTSLDCDK